MKIGVLTHDFYPIVGGQGRHIYQIYYQRLRKERNFDIEFITPCKNKIKENLEYFHFTKKFGKNIIYSFLMNFYIDKIIKQRNLDLLNIHCGPGGVFLFEKPKNVKIVATSHHTYWQQSNYISQDSWKKIFISFEKKTYEIADKIIAVSPSTKNIIVNKYKIPEDKITIIPNGIDTNKFHPIDIKKIPKSLLFVGRLDKRKGVDFLVKSMPEIIKKIPDVKLYIGGKGELEDWIKKYIEENNLEKNIKLLGFIPEEDLNKWYNKVELVVVPSIFEGFGLTVIESMAAGTPVIGTNVDGIRDIIKNKKLLFTKESLSKTITRHFKNSKSFSINKSQIEKTTNKYNIEKIAQKTGKIYENL